LGLVILVLAVLVVATPADGNPHVRFPASLHTATISATLGLRSPACRISGTKISRIIFYVDGRRLNTRHRPPWSCVWDTTRFRNGRHVLKAVAYASSGAMTHTSVSVDVCNACTRAGHTGRTSGVRRHLDFEHGGALFDGTNGSVSYSSDRAYSGSRSSKILMRASTIDRGWSWQDPGDFCAGSETNAVNSFAPIGSNRSIKAEFYLSHPKRTVGVRLLALSYDNVDCVHQATGSIVELDLDRGLVHLESSNYGGVCPSCRARQLSPDVDISRLANQWVTLEIRVHIARDRAGWGQLVVNGKPYPIVHGATMTTAWGNYNEIQWGAGWADSGTATQYLYLDDATVASF
jgi:hypothetical protein